MKCFMGMVYSEAHMGCCGPMRALQGSGDYESASTTASTDADAVADADDKDSSWVKLWLHMGHLHIEGRKMSKSLKNFITVGR